MNPKLLPILQRIIARDSVLRAFEANDLPQSALFYVRRNYLFADGFSEDEQDLLEELPPLADNLRESFRADSSSDASRYYLFDDDSLLIVTSAYQQVWADARDFAIECILPLMRLDLMDAELLRAIEMDDAVESIRDDFFHAFAETLHRQCRIPHCDARNHWNAFSRQLSDSACESIVLGGGESGRAEGLRFASEYSVTNA